MILCMRYLSTKWFKKWCRKRHLSRHELLQAIDDLEKNLSTSNLGGGLYKVRVSSVNSGKSSAFRTIIVYKKGDRAIFIYGFAKKGKSNLENSELQYLKKTGKDLLSLNADQLQKAIERQILFDLEVQN